EGAGQTRRKCPVKDSEAQKSEHRHLGDPLADMAEFIMTQFMGENGQDFIRRMVLQKRIEKDDPLGFPKSCEIGVAMRRTLGGVHDVEPIGFETAFGKQSLDARLQLALR